MSLNVTKIQHFSTKDGPGVRTTVFLKGCPLRCKWCHNPETQKAGEEFFYSDSLCISCGRCMGVCPTGAHSIEEGHTLNRSECISCMKCAEVCPTGAIEACSHLMSEDEVFCEVMKDAVFYGDTGGVTLSGGEPTAHGEALLSLLARFKAAGLHTALETCGYFDSALLKDLVNNVDLLLWDIKDTDTLRHRENTGAGIERIIANLKAADSMGMQSLIRCIMIKGVNMERAHYDNIISLVRALENCLGVELIPYHTYGSSKYIQLGMEEQPHPEWIPGEDDIMKTEGYLSAYINVVKSIHT